ncbi:hypothetical protein [Mucisphaera sp.]|uniref:hypothetical protein n=1 Tax=Mucisphaera sp. TaxID=2913024 RepID=UPI003D0B4281
MNHPPTAPNAITWVHDEMLTPEALAPNQPAIFVFDEDWLQTEQLSLKRIVFMYECLLELPNLTIRKGNLLEQVRAFAEEHHTATIVTRSSPLPRLRQQIEQLSTTHQVQIIPEPTFVDLPAEPDLKRFSRYWRKAERQLIR